MPYQQHYHLSVWRPVVCKRLPCQKHCHHLNDGILLCVRDCPAKSIVIILVRGVPLCLFNMTQITF